MKRDRWISKKRDEFLQNFHIRWYKPSLVLDGFLLLGECEVMSHQKRRQLTNVHRERFFSPSCHQREQSRRKVASRVDSRPSIQTKTWISKSCTEVKLIAWQKKETNVVKSMILYFFYNYIWYLIQTRSESNWYLNLNQIRYFDSRFLDSAEVRFFYLYS